MRKTNRATGRPERPVPQSDRERVLHSPMWADPTGSLFFFTFSFFFFFI
jgi:hypothetical protein